MTIVIVTPGFPKDESDTTCIPALQDFVLRWKQYHPEVEVRVIAIHYPYVKKHYHWNGIPVFSADGRSKSLRKFIAWLRVWKELRTLRKHGKDFILLSYFINDATMVSHFFTRWNKVKHFAIAAGQDVKKNNRYLKWIDFRKLKTVVLNKQMSDFFQESTGRKPDYIIPMGSIEIPNSKSSIRNTDLLIVGSLIPLKQVDMALKIIAVLNGDFPNLDIQIIGDGEERKNLEALCKNLQLQKNVLFTGELAREKIFEQMQQSKILLHTSSYEGQSTVITEALATGMTVVCFDVGRIADHKKIHVCTNEDEMKTCLTKLLSENEFDFTPVIPVTLKQSIEKYFALLFKPQD